jgi:hypothetical protein
MPNFSDAVFNTMLNRRSFSISALASTLSACGGGDSDDSPSGGIALAQGALSKLSQDQTAVGFGATGDIFVWDRGPSPTEQNSSRLIRLASDGTPRPLLGTKQALDLKSPWRISVLKHSNGNIYVSESYLEQYGLNVWAGKYGRIHRITPDGTHSVIYDAASAAVPITPLVLAEGRGARLYALHVNTVSLYEISETGTPSLVTALTTEPIANLRMTMGRDPYVTMAMTQDGDTFVSNISNSKPSLYKDQEANGIVAIGNHIYALVKEKTGAMSLMRRNPDGSTQRIAGGLVASDSLNPQPGPLSGSLGNNRIQIVGATAEGTIILGRRIHVNFGDSPSDDTFDRYFVVTPPKV